MTLRIYKYSSPFIVFVLAWVAFSAQGLFSFLPIIWAFVFIPTLELLMKPNAANMDAAEEELARNDKRYDCSNLLFGIDIRVPWIYSTLLLFSE
jgi:alkane 1-monooxygenase